LKRLAYITGISLIAACILLSFIGATSPEAKYVVRSLANPLPLFLSQYVPDLFETLLRWVISLLVARRIYLWTRAGAMSSPVNMTRLHLALIVFALACLALLVLNRVLLWFGFLLLFPVTVYSDFGIFLLAPTVIWVEVTSLRTGLRARSNA